MAQASRRIRKLRRLKRERSVAFRMLDHVLNQRDKLRQVVDYLQSEVADLAKPEEPAAIVVQEEPIPNE